MRFPVFSAKSAAFVAARPVASIALFTFFVLTPALRAQSAWTGASGTDWNTPGNWSPAAVPTAADDVDIPNTGNKPVIAGGTAAVAKSVTVESGAMLTVNAMGSLNIQGSASGGLLNQGTVTTNSGGVIRIGLTASPGQYGLVNQSTFNNNGATYIDRTGNIGLWNQTGAAFANTGLVAIGDTVGTGSVGLYNEAAFQNNGGELLINRTHNAGIHNLAGSSITNTGKIAIGKTATVNGCGIYNFASIHNNSGGELSIDRTTAAAIDNRQHSSFTNASKITIGGLAGTGGPGLYNAASFQNNGGELHIDRLSFYSAAITNYDSSSVVNSGKITIGTNGKIMGTAIYDFTYLSPNYPIFTNSAGGEITIDSTSIESGIHHQSGVFTNSGKLTIGVTLSINGPGLYNNAVFTNSAGAELNVDGLTTNNGFVAGIGNDYNASFTNYGKINIGAAFGGGGSGVFNSYNCTFTNNAGGEITIDHINTQYGGNGIYNAYAFTNSGKITIGNTASGGANGIYHNSGTFMNNPGAEISIDNVNGPYTTNGIYSGSLFTNSGKITIGSAVSGGIHGLFNSNVFNNNAGAEISIDHVGTDQYGNSHGLFNSYNTTFTNYGKITIGSTASAGHNGLYNTGTFNNNVGSEININHVADLMIPLNTHGLRNDNNFTNSGKIAIGSTSAAGQWGLWNASTFNNKAGSEIDIDRSDTCGLRNGNGYSGSHFTNSGKIVIGAAGSVGNYGLFNSDTFNSDTCAARIEVLSDNIIVSPGSFSNAGVVVENAAGNSNISSNNGVVQNLNGGAFSIGSGNPPVTVPGFLDACGALVSGAILWEQDQTSGVNMTIVKGSGDQILQYTTGTDGVYQLPFTSGSNFTITPVKNSFKHNGLTAADATAIQQHVANMNLLPGPFKRIAADVNKSNSITTLDASLVTQLLLGNPAVNGVFNTSWRFVPAAYLFPNPSAPWGFPEKITLTGVSGPVSDQDFYGIKLGDVVTDWANPANFGAGAPLVWRVQDQALKAGEEIAAEFRADPLNEINAFQFALHFDPGQLQLTGIDPGGPGLPVSMDNFGTYNLDDGEIRVVWAQASPVLLDVAAPVFRLRFKALTSGARLSQVLALDDGVLPGYCYDSALAESGVELRYSESTGTHAAAPGAGGVSLEVRPNPFVETTTLTFALPAETEAELRVLDASGRLLFSEKKHYTAGKHERILQLNGPVGVLFAELVTAQGSVVQKMLALRR